MQEYELDCEDKLMDLKREIERTIREKWQAMKAEVERREEGERIDHEAVLREVRDSKNKTRKL